MVYDVEQMLKMNKKLVTDEVTQEDIDPVLLLWDTKNQTWYIFKIVFAYMAGKKGGRGVYCEKFQVAYLNDQALEFFRNLSYMV